MAGLACASAKVVGDFHFHATNPAAKVAEPGGSRPESYRSPSERNPASIEVADTLHSEEALKSGRIAIGRGPTECG